jgi:DNA invertase Pin-like site-specific DNA recombinase
MTKVAHGYVRLSKKDPQPTSIDRQVEAIEQYALDHDLHLETIHNEGAGVSGFNTDREKYEELMTAVRNGEVDAVIVRDRSRFGRDKNLRVHHITQFWLEDIEFHTTLEGYIDPDDDMALIRESIEAQQDDAGKREEIEKARKEIKRRADDSECYHGGLPKGLRYAQNKRTLEPDPEERDAYEDALRVLDLREQGYSYSQLVEETGVSRSRCHRIINKQAEWFQKCQNPVQP